MLWSMDSLLAAIITLISTIFGVILGKWNSSKFVPKSSYVSGESAKFTAFKKDSEKKLKISKTTAEIPKA